jgi:hypothetical protein
MGEDTTHPEQLVDPADGLEIVSGDIHAHIADDRGDAVEPLALSSQPEIFDVSCSGGASAKFTIPINAYSWHARLGYFRPAGNRFAWSQIVDWNRSFYPGSVIQARWNGTLPRPLGEIRAYFWYGDTGDGPSYWSAKSVKC